MRPDFKTKYVNFRPQDRLNQNTYHDGINNTSDAEFAFNKPIHLKQEGRFGLRSAYVPLTYKNVIHGYNDRFAIKFNPSATSADADCVYATVQIPAGQYDTATALAAAINIVLGGLNATCASEAFLAINGNGGVINAYNPTASAAILSADMLATVDNSALYKNHIKIVLSDSCVFGSGTIKSKDGSTVPATTLDGGFQLCFGLGTTAVNPFGRSAYKLLGFGNDYKLASVDGAYPNYPIAIVARGEAASADAVEMFSPTLMNVLFTPYVFVRCDLVSDSIETIPQGSKLSNLLIKIPVINSGYGAALFYQPDDGNLEFNLAPQAIQNLRISLTDEDGRLLPLEESEWHMSLVFKGLFDG